ncbi:MAG TPA: CoB--CoM heterodisulfide reductase iron-sulfur subunit A family protein [Firmicutes bacterium]|nr:CoB--CoM heterodisulfide reductase iron-sulfur subunit A family protein [Bacillota bacterium]
MKRVGVFVCHCGSNIAGTVDCAAVVAAARRIPAVAYAEDNKYTCSEVGQEQIRKAVQTHNLDRVVVAACSPRMHEATFRKTIASVGLNPYMLEIANLREQCSWVHSDRQAATAKAIDLVRLAVAKVLYNKPLFTSTLPVKKRAVVIGGGIAGIQAALDIAEAGHPVTLIERSQSIGGRMAQLDKTFPTLDCSSCILMPRMVDVGAHPMIDLMTYSEVEEVDGFIGNFRVKVRQRAKSVDHSKCTGCGECTEKCPTQVPAEFEAGLGERKAIYTDFPQAVPNKPVIDRDHCRYFLDGKCGICRKVCQADAIDYTQTDRQVEIEAGAIVVATGFDLFDPAKYGEYGGGRYPDVITGLQFERLISASGPTNGEIRRPSDGRVPETIAFIKCVGSRDEAHGVPYCSRVCCMYTAKQAMLVKEHAKDSKVYIFYIDVRAAGKGYEEFYQRAQTDAGATYVRGRVAKIFPRGEKLVLWAEDTLIGKQLELEVDLVVLATGIVAREGAVEFAQKMGISYDGHRFYSEAHPKLRPVDTNVDGIFLAGACQGPKDIPDTVAQASAAAVKVCSIFSKEELETNAMVATVDENICAGCFHCRAVCPSGAIDSKILHAWVAGQDVTRRVATVNSGVCQGCGSCAAACPSGAMNVGGFSNEQILGEVEAL